MAPSDEENKRQKAQDDANPFISFRRFADDQMSTLMNGVFSISSLFGSSSTPPRRSLQDYEKLLEEARESSQRRAYEAEEAGRIMDVHTRVHKEVQRDVQEPASDNDGETLRCPYRPPEREMPSPEQPSLDVCAVDDATRSCLSLAILALRNPVAVLGAASKLGEPLPFVPVPYLLYSPYSPLWLEQQPRLCDHGAKWRAAFEDLLVVQSGQELPPVCSARTQESSRDWARTMIHSAMCEREDHTETPGSAAAEASENTRQYLGFLSCLNSLRQPENDADEDDDANNDDLAENDDDDGIAELDIYDRIFGSQQSSVNRVARAACRSFAHSQPDCSPVETDDKKTSVLSTLTTTERTTLQDGSVHTKVVLKKRFSDGREESTETVHNQNAVRPAQDAASKTSRDEDSKKPVNDQESKENKSSGWFWS